MSTDSGVIIALPQVESGISATTSKEWRKADVVIEWGDKFKNQLCVTFFNDKTDLLSRLSVGDNVTIGYNASSRAWTKDGVTKYFHNINGMSIDLNTDGGNAATYASSLNLKEDDSDLPF